MMQSLDCDLIHLVGDRVTSISSQAVDARSNQEMRSDLLCGAEKLLGIGSVETGVVARSGLVTAALRLSQTTNLRHAAQKPEQTGMQAPIQSGRSLPGQASA